MTVTKTGAIIAVWVVCGALIAAIVVVVIVLCFRRARRRVRQRYLVDNGAADGEKASGRASSYYPGYERLDAVDLCTDPQPGTYPAPRVVHVRRFHNPFANPIAVSQGMSTTTAQAPCDILVNVFYVDPATTSVVELQSTVLGPDAYNPAAFLLYTAPLEFIVPGVYVVQAYAVYETVKAVGPAHQFVFTILSADGIAATGGAAGVGEGLAASSLANRRRNDIEVNLTSARNNDTSGGAHNAYHASSSLVPRSATPAAGALAVLGSEQQLSALPQTPPLPPRITPAEGTVTTHTAITIAPNERSTTADQIRYSVDGSYPTVLYTGPFFLSIPPESILPAQRLTVTVKAIAVSGGGGGSDSHAHGGGTVSDVVEATMKVRPAGYSFFDPAVPAPSMRLRAKDATLYFDESKNPPGARTVYQLLYVHEARRRKAKFSPRQCQLYERHPIPIGENVAVIYAWTVDEKEWHSACRQSAGGQPVAGTFHRGRDYGLVQSGEDDDGDDGGPYSCYGGGVGRRGGSGRLRSVAAVYDCVRAAAEQAKPSRKRVEALRSAPGVELLPPPVICVSCAEMEIEFDDAAANSVIAYTLNNTEPALYDVVPPACAVPVASAAVASALRRTRAGLGQGPRGRSQQRTRRRRSSSSSSSSGDGNEDAKGGAAVVGDEGGLSTYRYENGRPIKVTLLETEGVYVTARVFLPIFESDSGSGDGAVVGAMGGQGGSTGRLVGYRYGHVFHRGFFFSD